MKIFNLLILLILFIINSGLYAPDASFLKKIRLPAGFRIEIYAYAPDARSLALGPGGIVFAGTISAGRVYAVMPGASAGERKAVVIADGLDMPNGVAYKDGDLYVAAHTSILRFRNIGSDSLKRVRPEIIYGDLPPETWHGWRYIGFGPDGLLYVSVGVPCNVCKPGKSVYGSISRMTPEGKNFESYVTGIRNSVGFDWDPSTGYLYFTDNGRDYMGDNLPPDKLDRAERSGLNFGFPYIHGRNVIDPVYGKEEYDLSKFTMPWLELEAHVAPLGMRFYTGIMFPPFYRGSIFVAEHGSWNRSVPIGYRVITVTVEKGLPVRKVFADGWLSDDGTVLGRPVDLLVMPDGSLLVSDDMAGLIYRISYGG